MRVNKDCIQLDKFLLKSKELFSCLYHISICIQYTGITIQKVALPEYFQITAENARNCIHKAFSEICR